MIESVHDRVRSDPARFRVVYSEVELNTLVAHGRALGLDDRSIENLIYTGSRLAKPIDASTLAEQMENWVNTVAARGYPYRFVDSAHFDAFVRDLGVALSEFGLGDLAAYIQGSSLRTPNANDVDFAIMIDRNRFNDILVNRYDTRISLKPVDGAPGQALSLRGLSRGEIRGLADDILARPTAYNGQAKTFAYAVRNGIIRSTHDISKGLKAAGKRVIEKYPELGIEDISLIVPGSIFDSSPELPVAETGDIGRRTRLAEELEAAREAEFRNESTVPSSDSKVRSKRVE